MKLIDLLLLVNFISICLASNFHNDKIVNNAIESLHWEQQDTPNPVLQLQSKEFEYYYFGTDSLVGKPQKKDSKTTNGIILEVNFENAIRKQINFIVERKPPGKKSYSHSLISFSFNFERNSLRCEYKTQLNDGYAKQVSECPLYRGKKRNSNKHTILIHEKSVWIDDMTRIPLLQRIDDTANILKFDTIHSTFVTKIWYITRGYFAHNCTIKDVHASVMKQYRMVTNNYLGSSQSDSLSISNDTQLKQHELPIVSTQAPTQIPTLLQTQLGMINLPTTATNPTQLPMITNTTASIETQSEAQTPTHRSSTTLKPTTSHVIMSHSQLIHTTNLNNTNSVSPSKTDDSSLYIIIGVNCFVCVILVILIVICHKSSKSSDEPMYHDDNDDNDDNDDDMNVNVERDGRKIELVIDHKINVNPNVNRLQLSNQEGIVLEHYTQDVENDYEIHNFDNSQNLHAQRYHSSILSNTIEIEPGSQEGA